MLLQRLAVRAAITCALALAILWTGHRLARASQLTVILVCPMSVAPTDCTRDTADDVLLGGKPSTPCGCLMGGMLTVARQAGGVAPDHYALTRCEGRPD